MVPDDDRDETEAERLDRNWVEMLQELRVVQTGTQILTGFLLTLAFQQRFVDLDQVQSDIYLVLVVLAVITTVLALVPVSLHRTLFRQHAKESIVRITNRIMKITLGAVGLVLAGTLLLIFDVVLGLVPGIIAGSLGVLFIAAAWIVLPVIVHSERRPR